MKGMKMLACFLFVYDTENAHKWQETSILSLLAQVLQCNRIV